MYWEAGVKMRWRTTPFQLCGLSPSIFGGSAEQFREGFFEMT